MRHPLHGLGAVVLVVVLAGCSGGGGGSSPTTTAAAVDRQHGAVLAARACRMWAELINEARKGPQPNRTTAAPLNKKSAAISDVANQAGAADPAWNALATDVAGATDFASAALPDINNRIVIDCRQVPAGATKTVAGEPDPFSTTTTTGA